jgi:hypothetical protein
MRPNPVTSHPNQATRSDAFAALAPWAPWLPAAADLAAITLEDLQSGPSWHPACAALVAMFADGLAGATTAQLIGRLAVFDDGHIDADLQRDRPARQRLGTLVGQLTALDVAHRVTLHDDLTSCARALGPVATALDYEIGLLLSAADPTQLIDAFRPFVDRLAARPLAAGAARTTLASTLQRARSRWQSDDLIEAADYLMAQASPTSALLNVAVITAAGARSGWNADWRGRLRVLRQSSDPDVAAAALTVVTASE